jgi:hypothetical protein
MATDYPWICCDTTDEFLVVDPPVCGYLVLVRMLQVEGNR